MFMYRRNKAGKVCIFSLLVNTKESRYEYVSLRWVDPGVTCCRNSRKKQKAWVLGLFFWLDHSVPFGGHYPRFCFR
ncbi:MAG: hypothetical protein HW380_2492 [Magnetococcales bacterium]|nr:hypothetical protein [Magnetococcales bacterium]